MDISTIMTRDPVVVSDDASLDEAMQRMDDHDLRHLPVVRDSAVVGVLSDRDLLQVTGWLHPRVREVLDAPDGPVGNFMHAPPITISSERPVAEGVRRLVEQHIGCLPVVHDEALVGIVTGVDVLRAFRVGRRAGRIPESTDVALSEVMTTTVICTEPESSAEEAADLLRERGFRHLPVVEEGRVVGVLSDKDVRRAVGRGELELLRVKALMSTSLLTVSPEERLSDAAHLLIESGVNALPVVGNDGLVGIVSSRDLLGPCAAALEESAGPD